MNLPGGHQQSLMLATVCVAQGVVAVKAEGDTGSAAMELHGYCVSAAIVSSRSAACGTSMRAAVMAGFPPRGNDGEVANRNDGV